jgi:alpha-L-rhamnosidase
VLGLATSAPLLGDLQVDGLTAPLAAALTPRFSWRVGGVQSTYRLVIASTQPSAAVQWDSGVVASNATWLIPYGAPSPLPPDADLTFTIYAELVGVGLVSATSPFSTAPPAPLPGAWLGFADTLRGSLQLDAAPVLRARLHVTGVGCYKAYANGALLSPPLAPGFGFAPSARALFDTFDLTAALRQGENVVGLRLGSCKWGAWGQYCTGSAAQCNAGWAALRVEQEGGNSTTLATSGAWLAANTSILEQNLWNGELFDARLEQVGWAEPAFANASAWAPATVVDTADAIGPLMPSTFPPVEAVPVAPVGPPTAIAAANGALVYVFDMGANVAGACGLVFSSLPPLPPGVALQLLHGELLHPGNGSVWNHYLPPGGTHQPNGLNQPAMNYTYITRGSSGGEEVARGPHFSYFGFRYVEIRGWPFPATPPTAASLVCTALHTHLAPTGAVAFPGSPALDQLQAATLRTHLSNYVTLPTDCPQREKRGWTGDAQLTAHSGVLNFNALAFYEAWHASILDQQRIGCLPPGEPPGRVGGAAGAPIRPHNWACDPPRGLGLNLSQYQFGTVSDVVPREQLGMGYFIGDPSWQVAATRIPYELLTQLGDEAHVAANWDGPTLLLEFFNALGQANASWGGLIPWSYLGDWVALDTPNNKLVANANYIMAALQTAEMAAAAGRSSEATKYTALAALLSSAMVPRFWNASAACWDACSQSANALCLALGVGGQDKAPAAGASLLRSLNATGGHLTVGASGAAVLLGVLHDTLARPDAALALALAPDFPGWRSMLDGSLNATTGTLWESWKLSDAQGGSSLNHIFKGGGISPYLYEGALGLRFAMRPASAAACASPPPCLGTLPLPWNAVHRLGLDCGHAEALCAVYEQGVGRAGATALAALDVALAAALAAASGSGGAAAGAAGAGVRPGLRARLGATVTVAAARVLGGARGWRATPAGNASFAWQAVVSSGVGGVERVEVALSAPAGADTVLELPLPLAPLQRRAVAPGSRAVAVVHLRSWGGRIVVGWGGGGALEVQGTEGGGGEWMPTVEPCAGGAAEFVEGWQRRTAAAAQGEGGGEGACQPVLLMRVPPGEHTLMLQSA